MDGRAVIRGVCGYLTARVRADWSAAADAMSWVKAVPRSDDVFDEDRDELSLQDREWRCNMEKRVKDGFRDGIDAGKDASLQRGFNLGYTEGVLRTRAIGQLKGITSALQYWCQAQPSMNCVPVTQLLQRIEKHEENLFDVMRRSQEQPSSSVGEVVEDMEDLGVEQSDDAGCCSTEGPRDCCKKDRDPEKGPNGTPTHQDLLTNESFETLLQTCMEHVTEMGLPEELKLQIQKLRHE